MTAPPTPRHELGWPLPPELRPLAADPDGARIASEFPRR
jgi:hypothetical protein